jgi:HEPN domain-containing protein/GNAT superfamily N-acetyltransferase
MELDYVAEWFKLADSDLGSAEHLLGLYPQPKEIICYHCEQSAEKYLKGYLVYKGIVSPPKIHDLNGLCEMCSEFDDSFIEIKRACSVLTGYGVQPRYPHEMEISGPDVLNALEYARQIRGFGLLVELSNRIKQEIAIREIIDQEIKSNICNRILRALPNWFGVEASIVDYVNQVKNMPFYAAFDNEVAIGFVAVKVHNPHTSEVCVMGLLREYHRQGIGRRLIGSCENYCLENNLEFLTVKTLDESGNSESYDRTRQFYQAMGFKPLEVFPLHWDEENPCLFMVKIITA